jgi:hypothetical protein
MKKERLNEAIMLVNEIERLEKILDFMVKSEKENYFGAPYTIKFNDDLSYRLHNSLSFSMFDNVLRSAIEIELEDYKKRLESI